MQSTTPRVLSIVPALMQAFAALPDPRSPSGRRYSLSTLLTLMVAALLANHTSVLAMADWATALPPAARAALGLTATPHQTTFARLLRRLDPTLLAQTLAQVFALPAVGEVLARGTHAFAIDGKAHRGRCTDATRSIHQVCVVDHLTALIRAHTPITAASAGAEAQIAPATIAPILQPGVVLTGDAAYCQRPLCGQIVDQGGDYLVTVKTNQPTLLADIQDLFAEPQLLDDLRTATVVSKGHGRLEVRTIRVSTDLADYSAWPYLAQVFELTRTWTNARGTQTAVSYGLTSLPAAVADAGRLLALKRGHWSIENRVHYVKDEQFKEDRSSLRCDHGPAVVAILRDIALNCVRVAGWTSVAAALRAYSRAPHTVCQLLGLLPPENA